jgi:transcriptional regulator with XRE-family HTH domain
VIPPPKLEEAKRRLQEEEGSFRAKKTLAILKRYARGGKRRGLSLRKLGDLSGVHFVSLANLEAGQLDPQLSTLLKLCKALRITLNQLVGVARPQKGG